MNNEKTEVGQALTEEMALHRLKPPVRDKFPLLNSFKLFDSDEMWVVKVQVARLAEQVAGTSF